MQMYKMFFYLIVPVILESNISCEKSGRIPEPDPLLLLTAGVVDALSSRGAADTTLRFALTPDKTSAKISALGYSPGDGSCEGFNKQIPSKG
jgi:hypothetical protein